MQKTNYTFFLILGGDGWDNTKETKKPYLHCAPQAAKAEQTLVAFQNRLVNFDWNKLLGQWLNNAGILDSNPLDGPKVKFSFDPSDVDKMGTRF